MNTPELADATEAAREAQEALTRRDEVIRALHATGRYSLRQIAAAADLTHPGVKKIIDRETTMTTITDDQITALRDEAGTAGDLEQVAVCDRALAGDADALAECQRVIAEAQARAAEEG